jgi:ATP-dependent Clp protease ATP-binding subunit ClpB
VGFDPAFGARPIKRAIQHLVSDPLAMAFLEGRFHDGDAIEVDAGDGDTLRFRRLDRPED